MQSFYIRPGGNFWIARDAQIDRIVGFVGFKKETEDVGELKRMAVVPEYRRRSIGLRLGETLISWAKENGFRKIKLATGEEEDGYPLYEKLGFKEVHFDNVRRDYYMELRL